jgi:2'-hydroxyisoflavone reductase
MRVLVIGGTSFIGRAVVERLRERGHAATLLNRGKTHPDLFPDVPRITVDRRELTAAALGSGAWDVAIDLSGYFPADVEASFAALRGRVVRYVFGSTCSVYADLWPYPIAEDAPLLACTPEQAVDEGVPTYGARKAECERRLTALCAEASMPLFIGRPVIVYGPHDYTDRMHFWLEAVRRGRVVLPGDGGSIFHTIFVRDLAALFVEMAETDAARAGVYNCGGTQLFSLRDLVREIAALLDTEPEIASVPVATLIEQGVRPQFDLPLWLDRSHVIADTARVQERLGFRSMPLRDALRQTLAAFDAEPSRPLKDVMDLDALWSLAQPSLPA